MTKVFVHGVPETSAIWRPLVDELSRRGIDDVVLLTPPGFGVSSGDGWQPTQDQYREWLVAELRRISGPIDLVGHDWGAGHTYGVAAAHPELLATWAADCGGLLHADYAWHDMAQAWQTPDIGEQVIAGMTSATLDDKTLLLQSIGMTNDIAGEVAPWMNDDMARCILGLYRSAAQPAMAQLGARIATQSHPNGLVLVPVDDHYPGTPEMAEQVAQSCGAASTRLESVGHWWMIQNPSAGADALIAHWSK